MSTNGQINTNTAYDSYFWVKWSQSGNQDIPNNRTKIAWSCGVYCGHNFYTNAIKMSAVSINGVQVYSGGTYSDFYIGDHTIASGTLDIQHNNDGTKTFSISPFTGWLYSSYNYSANGASYTLTQIPRKATITAAADFTDLDNPTISFSNPGGFPMDVWLEPNPVGDHLCVRTGIPNTGSYTWELTDAERNELRNQCIGNNCPIRLGLYSYVAGTQYSDYKDKQYTMVESEATKPAIVLGTTLNNDPIPDKFAGMWIQGKSRVDVSLTAEGKYGAKITSYWADVDGKRYTEQEFTSDVIQRDGYVDIIGYAKDSRGFTGSISMKKEVIAYSKPLVVPLDNENAILCYRSDENGKRDGNSPYLWLKAKCSYHSVSQKNTCKLQYREKLATEQWGDQQQWGSQDWYDLPHQSATDDFYDALLPGEYYLENSYTIQIRAVDDIGEQDIKAFDIPTRDVALHLGKGGKNVSVGSYCDYTEDCTFHSEWKAIFDNGVVISGDVYIGDMTLKDYILSVINEGG